MNKSVYRALFLTNRRRGIGALAVVIGGLMLVSPNARGAALQSAAALHPAIAAPTATPISAGASASQPITPDNAKKLTLLTHLGYGYAKTVDWSADNQWLAVGSIRGVWVYTAADYSAPPRLLSDNDAVHQLAFSPDGTQLVTVGSAVQVWDVATGHLVTTVNAHIALGTLAAFRLDKQLIAFVTPGSVNVVIWNLSTNQAVVTLHRSNVYTGSVNGLAFSPDGQTLAVSGTGGTALLDVHTGKRLVTYNTGSSGLGGWPQTIVFSPDGKRLIGGGPDSNSVVVWDTSGGQALVTLQANGFSIFSDLAFSSDGQYVAADGYGLDDAAIVLWDTKSGSVVETLQVPHSYNFSAGGVIDGLAFSPDGKQLASAGIGSGVILWDVATGRPATALQPPVVPLTTVAFSPDGQHLAATEDTYSERHGPVSVWNVSNGALLFTLHDQAVTPNDTVVAFSPDGSQIVTGDTQAIVRVWDAATGRLVRSFQADVLTDDGIRDLLFNPNGQQLAILGEDYFLQLVNVQSGVETVHLQGGGDLVDDAAFNSDGSQIAAYDDEDHRFEVWNTATGHLLVTVKTNPNFLIYSFAFSPDGKYLATGDSNGLVALWDVAGARLLVTLQGHHDSVESVSFSPDGQLLVSGGSDGQVLVWSVAKRALRATLALGTTPNDLAFSPDGMRLAAAAEDGTVWVWAVTG